MESGRKGVGRRRNQAAADASPTTRTSVADVGFPVFRQSRARSFRRHQIIRACWCARFRRSAASSKDGETLVASVFDLFVANYGVDRGFGGEHVAKSYDDNEPYTPAWAEKITGVPRDQIITVAREFALNAEKTKGRSMVIIGAGHEPLVPHGHELPRHHQHAGDVRLRRPVGRRLVALCRPGKAASANGLVAAGLRARLGPSAAADEFDLVVLRAYRPVALRDARRVGNAVADGAGGPVGRRADRLQRARRAHGLAAVRAAASRPIRSRCRSGRRRGHGGEGLRRQGAEVRRAEAVMR